MSITSPPGAQANKVVYVEAWQNNAKKADVFAENRILTGTTALNLSLPALPAGVYELRLMVFDGPPAGSYTWGTMRLNSVEQNLTVAAAPTPPPSTSGVLWDNHPKPADAYPAGQFDILKTTPMSIWFAGGDANSTRTQARNAVTAANGKIVSFILYNIPGRDGNNYSAGGVANLAEYRAYVDGAAEGIGTAPVILTIEPDALGLYGDLTAEKKAERIESIKYAIQRFSQNPNAAIYVDASQWIGVAEMVNLVKSTIPAGGRIEGIALNVSAYNSTASMVEYGNRVIAAAGLPWDMVIDTSRNGVATATDWCNPRGQGIGKLPTLNTGIADVDAFLWLKGPGESDGECNGGPGAGTFFPERAQELINNARL